jgi:cysteine desulfuration protein SufE
MSRLEEIIETFQAVDNDFRLELLLDYAEKLPPLPEKYQSAEQVEVHKVHECQTPVSLWVEVANGKVQIFADVPRESPTVRGFVSMLISAFNGAAPEAVLDTPPDLLNRTGLAHTIGMVRTHGLSAILRRIKEEVRVAIL